MQEDKLGRNPYFIGILSAIVQSVGSAGVIQIVAILILLESFLQLGTHSSTEEGLPSSQSLFYWNPFCNNFSVKSNYYLDMSQSLFYWNPFCNPKEYVINTKIVGVAILILLESFLQFDPSKINYLYDLKSQSLFYWNPFCNL